MIKSLSAKGFETFFYDFDWVFGFYVAENWNINSSFLTAEAERMRRDGKCRRRLSQTFKPRFW